MVSYDRLFWLVAGAQLVFWTVIPWITHNAPPLDVVEWMIVGNGEVATYKHPNLPGLLLGWGSSLFGGRPEVAFLISQLSIVTTFYVVYRLGKTELGAFRALAGTLLMTGIYYADSTR